MNTKGNREIERKYRINHLAYWECPGRIVDVIGERSVTKLLDCTTNDYYWQLGDSAQFVRLRDSSGKTNDGFSRQLVEVTAKTKDRGNNFNRHEVNTGVTSAQDAFALLQMMAGEPLGKLHKIEWVIWTVDDAVISIAQVKGEVFLEVEHVSQTVVSRYSALLESKLSLTLEPRSFFELFIEKEIN